MPSIAGKGSPIINEAAVAKSKVNISCFPILYGPKYITLYNMEDYASIEFGEMLDLNICTGTLLHNVHVSITYLLVNRPGVAGAVLQTALSLNTTTTTIGLLQVMGITQVSSHWVRRASEVTHNSQVQWILSGH